MKVLVADDYDLIRMIHVKNFNRLGITDVDQAENGEEAVAAVMSNDYDLIMLDCYMPCVDGIGAIEAIRASGSQTPIVFCTDEASQEIVDLAARKGATRHIAKPYSSAQFQGMMKELLKLELVS